MNTYWIFNFVNINGPFIGNIEENIICFYSFFTTLLVSEIMIDQYTMCIYHKCSRTLVITLINI